MGAFLLCAVVGHRYFKTCYRTKRKGKEKEKENIDALHQLEWEFITFHIFIPMMQFKAYAFVLEGGLMP